MRKILTLAVVAGLCAPAAQAFELVGGTVGLDYSSFLGSDSNDETRSALSGAFEFGIARSVSIQTDITLAGFNATDINATTFALHGIYHAGESSSFGAFIGRDSVDGGNDLDFIGVEAGFATGAFGGEIYIAKADGDGADPTLFGLKGVYTLAPAIDLGARFDRISADDLDLNRLSLTGEYKPMPELGLTAEIGSAEVEGAGSEAFAGIGVKFNFGARQGTAFEKRSVINLIPGL